MVPVSGPRGIGWAGIVRAYRAEVALFRSAVLVLFLSQFGVFDSNRESDVSSIHRMRRTPGERATKVAILEYCGEIRLVGLRTMKVL